MSLTPELMVQPTSTPPVNEAHVPEALLVDDLSQKQCIRQPERSLLRIDGEDLKILQENVIKLWYSDSNS